MRKSIFCLILGLALSGLAAAANQAAVDLHFFWSNRCPHCLQAQPFVQELAARNDWLMLHSHELMSSAANRALYQQMAAELGLEARSVPAFIFCDRMLVGFDDAAGIGAILAEQLAACHAGTAAPAASLPTLDGVPLTQRALWLSTLTIAGLDAFNPCAFFVLLSLLGLLVHAHERRRILIVGGIFVFTSALFYFLSMAAWLNLFLLLGGMGWITLVAGALALFIGAINIKDYLAFGSGPSLSIPQQAKPGLFRRMRHLIDARGMPALLLGAGALAVVANSYELLCTAGFPMVYTRLLTMAELSTPAYYAWLAAYNVVYILPLALIVATSAWTLGRKTLSQRTGRLLKLTSGVMMAGLGATLIVDPAALAAPLTGVGLLLIALSASALAGWRDSRRQTRS